MTHAAQSAPTRETDATYRRRAIIVTVGPRYLTMREKGRRANSAIDVPIDAVFDLALKLKARAALLEHKSKRGNRAR